MTTIDATNAVDEILPIVTYNEDSVNMVIVFRAQYSIIPHVPEMNNPYTKWIWTFSNYT